MRTPFYPLRILLFHGQKNACTGTQINICIPFTFESKADYLFYFLFCVMQLNINLYGKESIMYTLTVLYAIIAIKYEDIKSAFCCNN